MHALVQRERRRWRAVAPAHYTLLLRVQCFCPGQRGWLLMDVRNEKLARASDASGRSVQLTDWNTLTVEQLYDGLDRMIGNSRAIQILFDSTWHYPTYTYSNSTAVVDGWSILEARALHVLAR